MHRLARNPLRCHRESRVCPPAGRRLRPGLTLIELLIAVTLTLVIVGVMVRAFKSTSEQIGIGRARMDMHNQVRMATETLRNDLQNATCAPRPRGVDDERSGYFQYVEGPEQDLGHTDPLSDSFIGDHDDILALTVRSEGRPFRGRYNGGYVESYLAEVVWFVVHEGPDNYNGNYRLYRRVLLIRPDLAPVSASVAGHFEANDISARLDPVSGNMTPNSLEDLADRRNRYSHAFLPGTFPHEIQHGFGAQANWLSQRVLGVDGGDGVFLADRLGEDLILDHCVGFDIKAFSPDAPVFNEVAAGVDPIGQTIEFSDPAFANLVSTYPPATSPAAYPRAGGFVDLGVNQPPRLFTGSGFDAWFIPASWPNELPPANRPYTWEANTWCSWWAGYEKDGIDQDNDGLIDQGANGVDDDAVNGVDDTGERETRPPYAHPLRAIQVSVRMIEKNTNQVLQKTVKESFVPN